MLTIWPDFQDEVDHLESNNEICAEKSPNDIKVYPAALDRVFQLAKTNKVFLGNLKQYLQSNSFPAKAFLQAHSLTKKPKAPSRKTLFCWTDPEDFFYSTTKQPIKKFCLKNPTPNGPRPQNENKSFMNPNRSQREKSRKFFEPTRGISPMSKNRPTFIPKNLFLQDKSNIRPQTLCLRPKKE